MASRIIRSLQESLERIEMAIVFAQAGAARDAELFL
jgi:hypothetical protein